MEDPIVPGLPRTDRQIVEQTNLLAIEFLRESIGTGYTLTESSTKLYEQLDNPRFAKAWAMACLAQEALTGTDPNDALLAIADELDLGEPIGETPAEKALRLYDEYDRMPADRGGKDGPRGKAYQRFVEAKIAAQAGIAK